MSSITGEKNSRRRAHRVDLPMAVEIAGETLTARDWSVTGLAVPRPAGLAAEAGETVPARLVIPMCGASLALPVRLRLVAYDEELARFAFVDLSERDRRILRQYIELGVEGRLDSVEDMVALLAQPEVPSPIRDALVLSEAESEQLSCAFRSRGTLSLVLGLLFLLLVAATLFYNTTYRVEALGVAMGTVRAVAADQAGVVVDIAVREGQTVAAGAPLFALDGRALAVELERLDGELALLDRQIALLAGDRATVAVPSPAPAAGGRLKAGMLPVPLDLLERLSETATIALAVPSEPGEAGPRPDPLRLLGLERQRLRLRAAREKTALRLAARRVSAPTAGRVYRIARAPGDRVDAGEPVLLLATDRPPLVVARLRQEKALELAVGMEALVAVPRTGESFRARIRSLGSTPVEIGYTPTMEVGLGETLITLEPLDPDLRLEPFTRVSVWIRTFELPSW